MNNYRKSCLLLLASLSIATDSAIAASETAKGREYRFKAPDNKIITNTEQLKAAQGYKVEVYGSAEELLQQIKNIEPRAFAKGDIIQVGIFKQQKNAEDLVRKLAVRGFWARITPQ